MAYIPPVLAALGMIAAEYAIRSTIRTYAPAWRAMIERL
jgi:hypothetical protein